MMALVFIVFAAHASADSVVQPWERGVSETTREKALAEFRKGNELFTEAEYAKAARHYREALKLWDHPRAHGNLATALIHLDDPVEAMHHIEKALAFGSAPFDPLIHAQLLTNRKLLKGQLTRIEVRCDVIGADVSVDGKPLFTAPGKSDLLVRAGTHLVVAKKAGHLTQSQTLRTEGGQNVELTLTPIPLSEAVKKERRWAVWKPWAVVGGGALVTALGIPAGRASIRARDRYESEQLSRCPTGCSQEILDELSVYKDRARTWNRVEITAFVVGGATLISGGVLVFLNREREIEFNEDGRRVAIVPHASENSVALSVEAVF